MSSPSKKNIPLVSNQIKEEKMLSTETSGSPKKNQRKTPLTPKRKFFDEESPPITKASPFSQSSTGSGSDQPVLMGRSGRVRKAKIVFDPSDLEIGHKRKSASQCLDNEKVKRQIKSQEAGAVRKETNSPIMAPSSSIVPIIKRRKTIGSLENGCIICSRNDVKKGRFVQCLDCPNRGHFTCLRNAKYIGTSAEEQSWQCPKCQTCGVCCESSDTDRLLKCTACNASYHVKCMKEKRANVTKKNFKCDVCQIFGSSTSDESNAEVRTSVKKSSSDGFAGFSQEETTRSSNSSNNTNGKSQSRKSSHSSKSSSVEYNAASPDLFDVNDEKIESKTQSPDYEVIPTDLLETQMMTAEAQTDEDVKRENFGFIKSENSEFEEPLKRIKYDKKTVITPHDSVPDVKQWDCDEVYTYFLGTTTAEYAHLFKENQIDGDALLLIKREDVLNRFNLKLGPALRLYSHIVTLQYKNNNPILAWNEN